MNRTLATGAAIAALIAGSGLTCTPAMASPEDAAIVQNAPSQQPLTPTTSPDDSSEIAETAPVTPEHPKKQPTTDGPLPAQPEDIATKEPRRQEQTWSIDGTRMNEAPASGAYELALPATTTAPAEILTATDATGRTIDMRRTDTTAITDGTALGTLHASGTATWTANVDGVTLTATQPYDYETGTPATASYANEPLQFVRDGDIFAASTATTLDKNRAAASDTIMIDGMAHQVSWTSLERTSQLGTLVETKTGTVTGVIDVQGHTQHWSVTVNATRTRTAITGLQLLRTTSDGVTTRTAVENFDPQRTDYTISLPAEAQNDTISAGIDTARGEQDADTDVQVNVTVEADGSRRITVSADGTTYTITVRFQAPLPSPSDTNPARLDGIYANLTGHTVKGDLIDGWDPDRTDYTIRIGADAPGVYLLPQAPAGMTVTAADVKQTGFATEQSWLVVTADGAHQRAYRVRVVRDHATPTAPEAFDPGAFSDEGGDVPAPDESSTQLHSHGYTLDGVYHPVNASSYTIPLRGLFSYASHAGQNVTVRRSDLAPMRYAYDVAVTSPDGTKNAIHRYETTYLTEETNLARLQMIRVNNMDLPGFSPERFDYELAVPDPAHWVISTRFDKHTGMNVTVHKQGDTARISVTSADGLRHAEYTVRVTAATATASTPISGMSEASPKLAATGSAVTTSLRAAAACAMGGMLLLAMTVAMRLRRR